MHKQAHGYSLIPNLGDVKFFEQNQDTLYRIRTVDDKDRKYDKGIPYKIAFVRKSIPLPEIVFLNDIPEIFKSYSQQQLDFIWQEIEKKRPANLKEKYLDEMHTAFFGGII